MLRTCAALLVLSTAIATAAPVADFRFQNTLADTLALAPDLDPVVPADGAFVTETVAGESRVVRTFSEGGGLQLDIDGLLAGGAYSVAIVMRFDVVSSYERILDTYAGQSDLGLYVLAGELVLYTSGLDTSTDGFPAGTWLQVVFTRAQDGTATGYIDGYPQFRVVDANGSGQISEAALLRFFVDDGSENSAGAVARIRVFDTALSARAVAGLDDNLGDRIFTDGMETL